LTANHPRPDFFIVGAPKCGTTALSEYLRAHARVFLSTPKEPLFFCEDLPGLRQVTTLPRYLDLFARVDEGVAAVGEASAMYLFSEVAPSHIRRFNADARIIVMLRNPIDVAHAFHSEMIYSQNEDEADFAVAWELQEERRQGRRIPGRCSEPRLLQYREVARLGSQLERLLTVFPRDQVEIIVFDDFIRDTQRVYEEVLSFLGVPTDGRQVFPRINENKQVRSARLARLTQRPPRLLSRAAALAKRSLGLERVHLLGPLRRANLERGTRPPLTADLRRRLGREFAQEVIRIERLLDRRLDHWSADAGGGSSTPDPLLEDQEAEVSSRNGHTELPTLR
jgi:hypothetical protein